MNRPLGKWYLVRNEKKWMEAFLDNDGEVKIKLVGYDKEGRTYYEVEFNRNNWMNFTYLMHCYLHGFKFIIAHLDKDLTVEEYYKEELEGLTTLNHANDGRPGEENYRGVFLKKQTIRTMLTFESEVLNCFELNESSTTQ